MLIRRLKDYIKTKKQDKIKRLQREATAKELTNRPSVDAMLEDALNCKFPKK